MMKEPLLFKYYPGLKGKTGYIPLAVLPTPVEKCNLSGIDNLWIKRDDLSSSVYGGNKIRKLEFIIPHAKSRKKQRIVTIGGIGTNHGLATAVWSKKTGLRCRLILFEQPVTRNVKQNLKCFNYFGAEQSYYTSMFRAVWSYYVSSRFFNNRDYFLEPGGSNVIGTLGYVNAAFELKEQIERGELPVPECIICPVGSKGTMAGLALGLKLAGLKSKVLGVRVVGSHFGPVETCSGKSVSKLMKRTYSYLKKMDSSVPEVEIGMQDVTGEYFGGAYGLPTEKGMAAINKLRDEAGIKLDPCYTSKAFAAVIDRCGSMQQRGPVLFWHTYNSADISKIAEDSDCSKMAGSLKKFLSAAEIENKINMENGGRMNEKITEGMKAPDFEFQPAWKGASSLYKEMGEKGAVLFFIRYMGCPVCQLKMSQISADISRFREKGLNVFVALQSTAENVISAAAAEFPFTVICDPEERIFRQYGVKAGSIFGYIAPAVIIKAVKAGRAGFKHGVKEGNEMQLPAVFVIAKDGIVRYSYYGKNIGDLPAHEDILRRA